MSINNKRSYTEYTVVRPTTDFAIGFDDFDEGSKDNILVTLNGVLVESLGYAAIRKNESTVSITPAITEGTVRITRETDIDEPFHKFTAGALFSAKSMDENFQQVRHSQQEVRDGFVYTTNYVNSTLSDYDARIVEVEGALESPNQRLDIEIQARKQGDLDSRRYAEDILGMGIIWDGISTRSVIDTVTGLTQDAINKEFRNELDALPFEGGVLDDTSVMVTTNEAGAVARSLRDVNTDSINARYYGAKGDGISDDSVALQKYFRDADDNRRSSIFIPMRSHNYLIQSPLVVQEPVMVYGDAGATYNRGFGKHGAIIIGAGVDYAFDMGNERTRVRGEHDVDNHISDNPSDNWAVKNIKFLRAPGLAAYEQTAIKHTASHNGPDRGFLMREVSSHGLKHALHVTNQGHATQLATLVIENCCLSHNEIPVYAEGLVFGLRFVGNQCEQNRTGAIWGSFTSSITIEDNMLENQPDPIKITIPDAGGQVMMSVKRNYFEINSGTALIEVSASNSGSTIEVGPNFISRASTSFPDNYLLLKGKLEAPRNASIGFLVTNKDPHPVSLYETATIMLGSDIFSQVNYFKQFDAYSTAGLGGRVFTDDFKKLPKSLPENSGPILSSASPSSETELGTIRYHTLTEDSIYYQTIDKAVVVGDIFVLNLLIETSEGARGNVYFNTTRHGEGGIVTENRFNVTSTNVGSTASLFLVSLVCTARMDAEKIRVGLRSELTEGEVRVYGVSFGNEGQKVAGVSKEIHPTVPRVTYTQREAQRVYPLPTIAAGESTTVNVPFAGVLVGDPVMATHSQYHEDIKVEAVVSSTSNALVKFTNIGLSSVKLDEGTIKVKTF